MITDPVGDLLTRLKNASAVGHESVSVPFSNLKWEIAQVLKAGGYVKDIEKRGKKVRKTMHVALAYDDNGSPRITHAARVSKPGRRMYKGVREIFPVRYGKGMLVLSTPEGVLSDRDAREKKVGGEALFEIW